MSKLPMRSLVNAIFVPSGDHAGWPSKPALLVRRIWSVPSARIT
jgi:hypothetical protein